MRKLIFIILIIGVIVVGLRWQVSKLPPRLRIVMCDIGQGDAILIQAPGQYDLLIDGGPNRQVVSCLGKYLGFWNRRLELVMMSHPDADHSTGLFFAAQRYGIQQLLWAPIQASTPAYQLLTQQSLPATPAVAGQVWPVGPAELKVLWPLTDLTDQPVPSTNNASVVARLEFNQVTLLLTGDAETPVEQALLAEYPAAELQSDILKVSHHGSKSSTTAEFLTAVHPSIALVSVGANNRYGHPASDVTRRLTDQGVTIWRTDEVGDVVIVTDGQTIKNCSTGLDFFCWWW